MTIREPFAADTLSATLLHLSHDAIIAWRENSGIELWNRGARELYGYTEDEVVGRITHELLQTVFPIPWSEIENVLRTEGEWSGELRHRAKDGRNIVVSTRLQRITTGGINRILETNRDMTAHFAAIDALRAREHQLATITDSIPAVISFLDAEERYVFTNAEYERMTGRTSASVQGKTLRSVVTPEQYSAVESYIHLALAGTRSDFEFDSPFPDGVRRMMASYVPQFGEGGRVTGLLALVSDVTERRRLEREARETEQRIVMLLDTMQEGFYSIDRDFRVRYLNRQAEKHFGARREDLLGKPHWEIFSSARGTVFEEKLREAFEQEHPVQFEANSRVQPDRVVEVAAYPAEGGLSIFFRDVTDRRRAEDALRRSEYRYRTVLAETTAIVWNANASGMLVEPQPAWEAYTGQRWPSYRDDRWAEAVHPDDRAAVCATAFDAFTRGVPYQLEGRLWHAGSESYRHFICRAVPIRDEEGQVAEWIGTIHDVDDAWHAGESARLLASADYLLASTLDTERTLDSVCKLAVDTFADWCAVDLEENGILRRAAARHRDPALASVMEEWKNGEPPDRENAPLTYSVRESRRPLLLANSSATTGVGQRCRPEIIQKLGMESLILVPMTTATRFVGVLILVSAKPDRRYGERDLRVAVDLASRCAIAIENGRLYRAAQETARAKDEFLAVVSHELRTPMTAILGWIGMLKLGGLDSQTMKTAVESIGTSARAQAAIVDDLLEVSRIVTGKMRIDRQITTVTAAVEQAVQTVTSAAAAKGIAIETTTRGPVTLVMGDAARLQQVFWNILSNAVKFTPPGGRIGVDVDHADQSVIVSISDSGAGIAHEFLPHVFDRFTQAEPSLTRSYTGLGLGLAIAKSIVELHGGSIVASSRGSGLGATFTVTIPGMAGPATVERVLAQTDDSIPSLAGLHILAIDDDPNVRELMKTSLSRFGASVATAADAPSGYDDFLRRQPDVVVSDVAMPGEDGVSLMLRIRAKDRNVAAIAVTAYSRPEDRERVLAAGFDEFITKPLDPIDLARAIERLARGRKASS